MPCIMNHAADLIAYASASSSRMKAFAWFQALLFVTMRLAMALFVHRAAVAHSKTSTSMTIPDSKYGYTALDLHQVFAWMGARGRRNYILVELVELVVFIPCYAHFLSMLLLVVHRRLGREEPLTIYLPFVAAIFDGLENAAHIYTALYFEPSGAIQTETWLHAADVGAVSNVMKWNSLSASLLLLCWTYGRTTVDTAAPPTKKTV
ncbi:unnamed protein product [Aphanomyces euteiches]|nr:hypothetical protein LEN26_016999 [Aphanomyces euteiches]KAH9124204.1 hypothetical protein AeMF1_004984 [Aphanomyces euteiches]KAH9181661.1 hypothetical protein AeNC1_016364 [Aphanomyces euteiches]